MLEDRASTAGQNAHVDPAEQQPAGSFLRVELTKRHYQRLGFYWRSGKNAGVRLDAIDLDLAAAGLVSRRVTLGLTQYMVTALGEVELGREKVRNAARRAPHQELGARCAQWLRAQGRITWEDIEFVVREDDVSSLAETFGMAGGRTLMAVVRPDVFSLEPTTNLANIRPVVHEVKVTRSDALADFRNPEKRLAYGCLAEEVYFVTPAHLLTVDEIPAGCGLIWEVEQGVFEKIKKVKRRRVQLGGPHLMNLLIKGGSRSEDSGI
jgi:hypothetical protein